MTSPPVARPVFFSGGCRLEPPFVSLWSFRFFSCFPRPPTPFPQIPHSTQTPGCGMEAGGACEKGGGKKEAFFDGFFKLIFWTKKIPLRT